MSIKILFIAPYNGLKELVNNIKGNFPNLYIDVLVGDLEEGAQHAKDTHHQYDLIISRGGTAKYIKKCVPIPVIEVKVSGYDVLKILTLADGYPGKSAIVGFSNIAQGARTIASLLDLDIKTVEIDSGTEVESTLTDLQKEGITSIIGDTVTIETAKRTGLNGILITSGTEAVFDSFQEARQTYELVKDMQDEIQCYKEILDREENAYILMDNSGNIVDQNQASERFIQRLGKEFNQLQDQARTCMQTETTYSKVVTWKEDAFDILFSPFKKGLCWIRIAETTLQTHKMPGIQIEEVTTSMNNIGSSRRIQNAYEEIQTSSTHSEPVLLIGESGTGKCTAAKEIHKKSNLSHLPFATVLCDTIPADKWETMIHSALTNEHFGTCYMINLDKLNSDKLQKILQITRERKSGPRLITGVEPDRYHALLQEEAISQAIHPILAETLIELPPLRERKEDIESWAHYLISHFNTEHGGQVVGFREGALALLHTFSWPGNIRQLTEVIKQLVAETNSFYIETAAVEEILHSISTQTTNHAPLSLTGTLDEIEKEIIKAVLKEENYNKSKTAARLGINRSTLWRKLQP
jgi:transcriptional regulator, propionate catabolism operon regulatory protein